MAPGCTWVNASCCCLGRIVLFLWGMAKMQRKRWRAARCLWMEVEGFGTVGVSLAAELTELLEHHCLLGTELPC